ncbi:MAG: cytochrome c [Cyclobacteriaceae bacterium]
MMRNLLQNRKSVMRFVTTLVLFLTVSISSLFGQTIPSDDASIAAGKKLFSLNCKSCHAINKQVVGPALAGVTSKHELSWLLQWIKNAPEMIASGDDQAVALYAQYKSAGMMNAFASFSETDILSILAYINTGGETPPPPGGGDKGGEVVQTAGTDSSFNYNIRVGENVLLPLLIVTHIMMLSSIVIRI